MTLLIVALLYIGALVFISLRTRQKEKDTTSYFLAGSNLGSVLGLFTFAATLFSTFTLIGMPDFFRTHGIGSWIFLAFSDEVMVLGIIFIGFHLRKKTAEKGFKGMAGLMSHCYERPVVGYLTFIGASLFLIPYVAIQIRGIAIFLQGSYPAGPSIPVWASLIVLVMLIYSEVGGLKAIIYSDTLQGILLLVVIWIIGINCVSHFGGIRAMFDEVEQVNAALLSMPGPKKLFDFQFLLASMIAITMIPYTQPQVATRLVIMRNNRALFRMAVGVGFFALLVIFPTALLGMYGAVLYPEAPTDEFISQVLLRDQPEILGSLAVIGLIAAAISTSDSQIFAMGTELRSLLTGKDDAKLILISRIAIVVFALITLVFSLFSSNELVLLARTSFAGTALLAPMIFTGIFNKQTPRLVVPILTGVALLIFILSLALPSQIPSKLFGIRLDLLLFAFLGLGATLEALLVKSRSEKVA